MPTIVLIHSDAGGHPSGGELHFVALNGKPLPAINQMALLTAFDTMACGVAVVESVARFYGRAIPADAAIAWDEGNEGRGCSPQGVVNGLAACGLAGTLVSATPGPQFVMNPAWGGSIPPEQSQVYLDAAAVGWPGGWSIAVTPPPARGDGMGASFVSPGQQHRLWIDGQGQVQHVWFDGQFHGPVAIPGATGAAGGLSAMADGDQQLVYYTGADGGQHEVYFDKGRWNGPIRLPGT